VVGEFPQRQHCNLPLTYSTAEDDVYLSSLICLTELRLPQLLRRGADQPLNASPCLDQRQQPTVCTCICLRVQIYLSRPYLCCFYVHVTW